MDNQFTAYRIEKTDTGIVADFQQMSVDELTDGDVLIRAEFSGINYKDALAATGAGRILRRFPLNAGIDVAGVVEQSEDARFAPGDPVLVTGCGLGEEFDGGYAQFVRARGDWVIPVPDGLDTRSVMAIGTAGFTAALAVHRMEQNGQAPGNGPIAITGASGGVGSIALDMLAGRGYEVVAISSKKNANDYLGALGASRILHPSDIDFGRRPLEKALWAGAVDNLGGEFLTWLTRTTDFWGNIASIGLASSHELNTTVMPFILRGVSLLGINSVETPRLLREAVWERLAGDLKPPHLDLIASRSIGFDELPGAFQDYLDGKVTGRTIVAIPAIA